MSAAAYLSAKIVVYSAFTAIQTAIVVAIVVIGKGAPTQGALLLGSPTLDFYVSLTVAAIVSAILGLLLSSLARSSEQITCAWSWNSSGSSMGSWSRRSVRRKMSTRAM